MTRRIEPQRAALAFALLSFACAPVESPPSGSGGESADVSASAGPSGAVRSLLLNDDGRRSLGLVLEEVGARPRGAMLDLPGEVELRPDALHMVASPLAGRIELLTGPMSVVEEGAAVLRVDAPAWRALQADLSAADAEIEGHLAWLREAENLELAHARHEEALAALEYRWRERLQELERIRETAGGQAAALVEAQAALFDARARLSEAQEVGARLAVDRADRVATKATTEARRRSLLGRAATLTRLDAATLVEEVDGGPVWTTIDSIEVTAQRAGRVDMLLANDGAWVDEGAAVLRLRREAALWVHADIFQVDLPKLVDGAAVTVRPAAGIAGDDRMAEATIRVGLGADARGRSAEVIADFVDGAPDWARPGLAVRVELAPSEGAPELTAVPTSAVRRDGIERAVWVEDPRNAANLVLSTVTVVEESGGWAWIEGAVKPGMRVVVQGAGRLSMAVRRGGETGGHFHADGTFHAGDH